MISAPLVATVAILVLALVAFAWGRLSAAVIAVGVALALWATGVLTLPEALAGFANPTVMFIAALFVVSESLDATGVSARVGRIVVEHSGTSPARPLVILMLIQSALSAVMSVSGAVATMLPVAVIIATRLAVPPSRLLMPMLFATHAGSMLVLTGTPVNVIVSELAAKETGTPFGFFDFAVAGVPLVIGTVVLSVLLRRWLLPDRPASTPSRDLLALTDALVGSLSGDDEVSCVRVVAGSSLVGRACAEVLASPSAGIRVLTIRDTAGKPKRPDAALAVGDVLTVRAPGQALADARPRLGVVEAGSGPGTALVDGRMGIAEFVVAPRSRLVGVAAFPGMVIGAGDLVVLAVHRDSIEPDAPTVELGVGDVLLLHGSWDALDAIGSERDLLVVEDPVAIRRQVAPIGRKGWIALGILIAMVAALACDLVPAAVGALLAAGAVIILRIVPAERAFRSISWPTVILVAGLIPISTAFAVTGLDNLIGSAIVSFVGPAGPHGALLALCVVVLILGQVMSNTATVLVVAPVAVSVASLMEVSALPFLMALTVSGAASLLTPVATAANLVIQEPGSYRFSDYLRFGAPLAVLYLAVAVLIVPLVWPF
ncbi:SLC13 family permease [Microbacterium immunditiarum]|uniref:Di/tricarboxylate transporter n=1 Tax=Microbacterium immunditiarum TaxID=337480 RepID=A0A7Y9GLP1_9MICO|nr:SLC13 family permease [Microbacterium immunditiarum]NYE18795.1 di/tricarboxylate transporter [Microbacterium immunditiarum]